MAKVCRHASRGQCKHWRALEPKVEICWLWAARRQRMQVQPRGRHSCFAGCHETLSDSHRNGGPAIGSTGVAPQGSCGSVCRRQGGCVRWRCTWAWCNQVKLKLSRTATQKLVRQKRELPGFSTATTRPRCTASAMACCRAS